jgi:hypothetical protein
VNTISVGAAERPLTDADPAWIRQQFNESLRKGGLPCVRVVVQTSNLNLVLQIRNCSAGGVGSRPPNGHEHEVLNLWSMEGLNNVPFSERAVVDFVARVKRLIQ